jgi:hypothetical protein
MGLSTIGLLVYCKKSLSTMEQKQDCQQAKSPNVSTAKNWKTYVSNRVYASKQSKA